MISITLINYLLISENNFEVIIFIFERRNIKAVLRHPKPYLILLYKLMDEASAKYFVGQLTSAIVYPNHIIWASI